MKLPAVLFVALMIFVGLVLALVIYLAGSANSQSLTPGPCYVVIKDRSTDQETVSHLSDCSQRALSALRTELSMTNKTLIEVSHQ